MQTLDVKSSILILIMWSASLVFMLLSLIFCFCSHFTNLLSVLHVLKSKTLTKHCSEISAVLVRGFCFCVFNASLHHGMNSLIIIPAIM